MREPAGDNHRDRRGSSLPLLLYSPAVAQRPCRPSGPQESRPGPSHSADKFKPSGPCPDPFKFGATDCQADTGAFLQDGGWGWALQAVGVDVLTATAWVAAELVPLVASELTCGKRLLAASRTQEKIAHSLSEDHATPGIAFRPSPPNYPTRPIPSPGEAATPCYTGTSRHDCAV